MRLLVFQHIDCEHPGSLRKFLAEDQIEWDAVNLHRGEPIPELDRYDALWVMGGPMDVWDVEQYPWLVSEKAAIREWVRVLDKPFLGLCLGHQLLADALGGTCGPQKPPEIGVLEIELTDQGREDSLFRGASEKTKCLQWHSVRVAQPPDDAVVLARSELCPIQAMRIGSHVWSMQYHVEIEPDTIDNWAAVPAYYEALVSTIGANSITTMKAEAGANMSVFLRDVQILYNNFKKSI